MPKAKIVSAAQAALLPRLELTTLGRPFHLLPLFMRTLESELSEFFEQALNRRYRAGFRVAATTQSSMVETDIHRDWFEYGNGLLAASIDRSLLLQILDYRFGVRPLARVDTVTDENQTASAKAAPLPVQTDTERRLAHLMAENILPCISRAIARLEQNQTGTDQGEKALCSLDYTPAKALVWQVAVSVEDMKSNANGTICLAMDSTSFEQLLKALSTRREPKQDSQTMPFIEQVTVRLTAQLMEKTLTLGDVFGLKIDSILPVTLRPRADVLIGNSRIYMADVAEHNGKLCLTGFSGSEVTGYADASDSTQDRK